MKTLKQLDKGDKKMLDDDASLNVKKKQLHRFRLLKSKYGLKKDTPTQADHEFFEVALEILEKKIE